MEHLTAKAALWDKNASELDFVMDVNVKGAFLTVKHLMPLLLQEDQAAATSPPVLRRIVLMGSGQGRKASGEMPFYSTSKWAVEGMAMSIAASLRSRQMDSKLICVPLAPGMIATGFHSWGLSADKWAKIAATYILWIPADHNGWSVSVPGMYPKSYTKGWVIKSEMLG